MAVSFFALFDDIASVMDDVAMLTKVATKKTAGVLGDDLALNAYQLTGLKAKRELPVIWAVTKGSVINKLILVPVALLMAAFLPWAVKYMLMIGGAYLCYEGTEKVLHLLFPHEDEKERQNEHKIANAENVDLVAFERKKIKGAIRTDFILSAEIVVIALNELLKFDLSQAIRIASLSVIALLITVLVYGTVAVIVKMDDVGLYWREKYEGVLDAIGRGLLWFAPRMLKTLSIVGTAAMFIVGGHIWVEGLSFIHHAIAGWTANLQGVVGWLVSTLGDVGVGVLVGLAAVAIITPLVKLWRRMRASDATNE
ncbi:DUF808 domain-containing protein [Suttonella sp. R2A3]|uniref:DUF808 domain-containing protein n=1 Tax=Suttonella sp. R2A3 TaxID=2908648 RepID=UPI001F27923A|nr:DUF808 domain-containing protein [Suttonella sp. R2A3]UJF24663.1 DUF808 domain-containing protein [Suttonella sp. R2A3]